MKLPKRTAAKRPTITPAAQAEYNLLQRLALQLGHEALKQAGIPTEELHTLPGGGTLRHTQDPALREGDNMLLLNLRATVTVNPRTGAVVSTHTTTT